MASLTEITFM